MIEIFKLDVLNKETNTKIRTFKIKRKYNDKSEMEEMRNHATQVMTDRYTTPCEICLSFIEK